MDVHAWISVATLVAAMALFISKVVPLAVTALCIPVVLAVTGTLPADECLAGFGDRAVIAVAAIFILGAGLQECGVATLVARGLERLGGRSPTRSILVIMIAVAGLSAFMSNSATVAVFLPAVAVLARRTGIEPSRLMMPLGFAAILGGTLTLIGTTPNLILGSLLRKRTGSPLGMFEFAEVGAPLTLAGIAFMAFLGWRLLPRHDAQSRRGDAPLPEELAQSYGFTKNLHRKKVRAGWGVTGANLAQARVGSAYHLDVVLVLRAGRMGQRSLHPGGDLVLEAGDELYVEGEEADARRLGLEQGLAFGTADPTELERILGRGVTLAEVTLAPRSAALGKTLRDLRFRNRFGLNAISVWRGDQVLTQGTGDLELQLGDSLLVSGAVAGIRQLARDPDWVVLGENGIRAEDVSRAPLAVGLLLLAIVPPLFNILPLAISAMAAALLMVFLGCLTPQNARRSVDFTILFLVIGTIPLGTAMETSGVAAKLAQAVLFLQGHFGEAGLMASLFFASAILSTTSNNGAAAVILAPVAAMSAEAAGAPISKAFLAVAYGASCAFVLPFAHQCNLMVMGPGGYGTKDFARVGGLMTLVVASRAVALLCL